ncbi:RNA-dependent RNA polymerase [viral metagenome]|uniref:RNA-dependent RNA polymerase n=1 Tax=viral metagenome TaxID=1070528 RepID=A0A6L2ZKY4_9ZZZZ
MMLLDLEPTLTLEEQKLSNCECEMCKNEGVDKHLNAMPSDMKTILTWYTEPPQGIGRKARLTPLTAINAIKELDECDAVILMHNKGWVDFSVASLLIYYRSMPAWIRELLIAHSWHKVPLREYGTVIKPIVDQIVRFGLVKEVETEERKSEFAAWMRKIMTLTGRDLKPADYVMDLEKTKAGTAMHTAPKRHNIMSVTKFNQLLWKNINVLVQTIMQEILEKADFKEFGDWWKERWKWTPSGSSSLRHNMDEVKEKDERIGKRDRPNKKTVTETLYVEQLVQGMTKPYKTSHARMSTKPEPGFKRRVLYALDDVNNHISAYAATEMEKYMNIGGMVAKQTPVDVINWWKATATKPNQHDGEWWASLDYSDFNKDHNRHELAMVELAFAKWWGKATKHSSRKLSKVAMWKRLAGLHTGLGHLDAWSEETEIGTVRNWSGLWSGHRTTARDNTLLHMAYFRTIQDIAVELFGEKHRNRYVGVCGDDEDATHADWTSVAVHIGLHKLCGFSINATKQRVDTVEHEFLQRNARATEMPKRPIANVLAALSTGTWYKDAKIGLDRNASELIKNFQEAVNRGAQPWIMRRTAFRILNALYEVETVEGKTKLDWTQVMSATPGEYVPLFDQKQSENLLEFSKIRIDLLEDTPVLATNDWVGKHAKWFLNEKQMKDYAVDCSRETYKAMYASWANAKEIEEYAKVIPKRTVESDQEMRNTIKRLANSGDYVLGKKDQEQIVYALANMAQMRRPATKAEVLSRMGLDISIFEKIGGWKQVFKKATQDEIGKYERIEEKDWKKECVQKKIPVHKLDTAVASWLYGVFP